MSLLYAIIFSSRSRSNHHRLALDALRHLRSPDAGAWRALLLHHHDQYLKGAKAPDDEFKDFKNHVLHVRDKDWGGAVEACQEWYRRTLRALRAHDWKQAAWSAGVLSHYYVDPLQPFHTHQTEEEGVIHRAVEWSFSKSYKQFQFILEREGYPELDLPPHDKDGAWLAAMVRDGALASNPHYETIIDHYDLESGVKNPPAGLDDELRQIIARLVGHAAIGLAGILDRAFLEAGVAPPRMNGAMQAFFLALEMPIQTLLAAIDDARTRREVEAQYEEFRRTGKVRATLGEDDKVVRALYAVEVLNAPLSSLDAKWPREIGLKAGGVIDIDAPQARAPKPRKAPVVARELPVGAPLAKPDKAQPKFTLDSHAPVEKAPSIGPKTAKRLEAAGVRTIADLLALQPEAGQLQIGARHISAQLIRDWQAQALLACTVPGLKSREAQALVACGVREAGALARSDAENLTELIARWGLSDEGARAWGAAPAPNEDDIATWIARAKRAEAKAAA
jgi:predicted flap endonuclease-1-like 5' DNA nuclease